MSRMIKQLGQRLWKQKSSLKSLRPNTTSIALTDFLDSFMPVYLIQVPGCLGDTWPLRMVVYSSLAQQPAGDSTSMASHLYRMPKNGPRRGLSSTQRNPISRNKAKTPPFALH